ncbi:DUF4367 domain-containing protein [Clostridium tagluense]|uniref:DUF4367 domain-containing protein n=1 Tax=Clostridium tagluense TaxID=360422 RepID=UPI001C0CEC38|nr:DUF4367 domain-containing protein [Clostridium tagluense]MBU3129291.1 DUF4367 domain-containing protein [Clostridium tagluense]MCB2310220.1 DUF4367 domain-containing protein [Clostridium tagluense]MCB2315138.1 DUF4367 domain-containing protein [Clostridium tagluense]MCB2319920.1 DUF4367 domain-containing protein [Clostridium tagluense]MCB2324881.1 DUF4367 domain-containing protein [Clostridium tagluense]
MSNKRIEDKFSREIDAYFNGIEDKKKIEPSEYNELLEFSKNISNKDFSKDSNKQVVFNKTLKSISENKGENVMKKSNQLKKTAISVAAICIVSVSLMQTSFARDIADKVIRTISLGHISVVQMEPSKIKEAKLPDEFKGKVFDKHGKSVEVITVENAKELYTAKGEKIANMQDGKIITLAEYEKMRKNEVVEVKDSTKLNEYTCFDVKLPTFLPEGYKFDRAEVYKEENETKVKNSKYIDLYFTNKETGKFIFMQQRFPDKTTKYVSGTDDRIEETKINGVNAIISDGISIDWETKNALYNLSGRGVITKSELIKIAESIK